MSKINVYNCSFEDVEIPGDYIIVSDPPYNINFSYNEYNDNLEDDIYIYILSKFKGKKLVLIHYPEYVLKYFVPALGIPDKIIQWCCNSNLPGRQHRSIML